MDTKTEIISLLEQFKEFFASNDVKGWTEKTEIAIRKLNVEKETIKEIMKDFVGVGMGSLIDLYICEDNGHTLKQNEEDTNYNLSKLKEQILIIKNGLDRQR